ncbi:MAG: ABC transporter ATP-binding protein [Thermodesulfobacteriota bacterium]
MLKVVEVEKTFDRFMAVNRANLEVGTGEIVAVIGPNGAGKSTLFKLIAGHLKPDSGRVVFRGENVAGLAPYRICRKGISLSFQVVNIFHRLTVFENVQVAVLARQKRSFNLFTRARTLAIEETLDLLATLGLSDVAHQVSASLSHGDQKLLEMAIALGNRPELLILDEPTAGMSPEETSTTMELIVRLNAEMGQTILFCEHDMELVFAIANRIMVMQQGVSIMQGSPDEVRDCKAVQDAYLGGSR